MRTLVATIPATACRIALHAALLTAIFASLSTAVASAPPTHASSSRDIAVNIDKFAFVPKVITVTPGTTLVWTNHDDTPHMVMAGDRSFSSQGLDTGDRYRHTFTQAGDFSYFCTMHPFMTGIVHVRR